MIRKAKTKDLENIIEFERAYMLEHESVNLPRWEKGLDKTRQCLIKSLDSIYVIEIASEVLGHAYWSMDKEQPCVYSIYVKKPARKKGYGVELMKALEEDVRRKGYHTLTLQTLFNNPAQFVFDKMAYVNYGEKNGYLQYRKAL